MPVRIEDTIQNQYYKLKYKRYGNNSFQVSGSVPIGPGYNRVLSAYKDYVSVSEFEGTPVLKVAKEGLTAMANAAFRDVSFMLRRSHNEQVAKILSDPEASDNDKYVALTSCVTQKLLLRVYFLSVRIPVRLSSTAKRDSRCGLATAMKRHFRWVYIKPIRKRTCAIRRTLP